MPRIQHLWGSKDLEQLETLLLNGYTRTQAAGVLGRTTHSVKGAAKRAGLHVVNHRREQYLGVFNSQPTLTYRDMASRLGVTERAVHNYRCRLRREGVQLREGDA